MRVLMFGWEFPPHISGGLGTACLGLATALKDQQVDLLFVVPHARGDESIPLINASDIVVDAAQNTARVTEERWNPEVMLITVPAEIKPYSTGEGPCALEAWNWQFTAETRHPESTPAGVRYQFTGGYGPTLLSEVSRYAEVGAAIAGQYAFDVIHAHDWLTFPAGIEAKNVSGKPLVVHIHATEIDRAGEDNVDLRVFDLEKQGMLAADRIIAVSQWTKDILVDKYDIPEAKVMVVHNGVTPRDKIDIANIPSLSDHVVTFLGRVTYQKGPQYFIDAAQRVLEYFPDTHFIVAGSGDLLPQMIEHAAYRKISSRIHFTGFLKAEQMRQVWSVTQVYVMPSVSEPFGITPLEAVQAGVPVIVSNQSGVAEVMDHIVKIDFWDTGALADAIINLFRHTVLVNALRGNSKREIKLLTWKRAATTINQLYHELGSTLS